MVDDVKSIYRHGEMRNRQYVGASVSRGCGPHLWTLPAAPGYYPGGSADSPAEARTERTEVSVTAEITAAAKKKVKAGERIKARVEASGEPRASFHRLLSIHEGGH
jgi:hypothetical protein